jgi:hypothetical protein
MSLFSAEPGHPNHAATIDAAARALLRAGLVVEYASPEDLPEDAPDCGHGGPFIAMRDPQGGKEGGLLALMALIPDATCAGLTVRLAELSGLKIDR